MDNWFAVAIALFTGIMSSTGLWAYIQRKHDQNNATDQLMLGLAHDRIVTLGICYIERGNITKDEYQDFIKYLYTPYSKFGGNGLAEKIKEEVSELPIVSHATSISASCPILKQTFKTD